MIRVLVADSTRIHTRLLADALTRHSDLKVIPFESDSSELVAAATSPDVDVLVISSSLDEQQFRGLDLLREVRKSRPDIRAVVLQSSSKDEATVQAFRAGARGVFGRNEPLDLLSKCVRCVSEGEIWASSRQLGIAIAALADSPTVRAVSANGVNLLSKREVQVVRCLAEGLTNREIGQRLKLSQHTIKNYLFRVFNKLGVSSRIELLFMTLSQPSLEDPRKSMSHGNGRYSQKEAEAIRKSAEEGLPAAQLALSRVFLAKRGGPQDLIEAYMWYLVATRRAGEMIAKMMTPRQVDEAEGRASAWIPAQNASSSIHDESTNPESTENPPISAS